MRNFPIVVTVVVAVLLSFSSIIEAKSFSLMRNNNNNKTRWNNFMMGWYGATGFESELTGSINAFWTRDPSTLVAAKKKYGFTQQLLALEDDFIERYKRDGKYALRLIADWQKKILSSKESWQELLNNGTIVGFWLGDELAWNCFPMEDLIEWSNFIRAQFPDAFIAENEAVPTYNCDVKTNKGCHCMSGFPINITNGIPPALDVTSIDMYSWNPRGNRHLVKDVQKYYQDYLVPRLHPHQKLQLVPGADASTHNPECNFDCYDQECARNAHQFYEWVLADPRIVSVQPWTWRSCGKGCIPPKDEIGARHMNLTSAAWKKIGSELMKLPYYR